MTSMAARRSIFALRVEPSLGITTSASQLKPCGRNGSTEEQSGGARIVGHLQVGPESDN